MHSNGCTDHTSEIYDFLGESHKTMSHASPQQGPMGEPPPPPPPSRGFKKGDPPTPPTSGLNPGSTLF